MEWLSDGYTLALLSSDYTAYNRRTGILSSLGPRAEPWVNGWSPDRTKAIGFVYPGAPDNLNARVVILSAGLASSQFISPADQNAIWPTWQPAP